MPGTEESRKRGEFFRGPLDTCIRSLKEIGTGDLFLFENNNINQITKIPLKKRNVTITPDQVELRSSPRFSAGEQLINEMMTDTPTQRAIAKLANITPVTTPTRKSPRLEGLEVVMGGDQLDSLRKNNAYIFISHLHVPVIGQPLMVPIAEQVASPAAAPEPV